MESTSDDATVQERGEKNNSRPPPAVGRVRSDGGDSSLDRDTALELLGDERRRAVLACLRECNVENVSLEWLVQQVAEAQPVVTGRGGPRPGERTHRIAVSLHHSQLPKLVNARVVAYDVEERTCRYLGDATLDTLLDTLDQHETP